MAHKAIVVFTGKTVENMVNDGGSSAWALDQVHARQCEFVVCARNSRASFTRPGPEPHGSAFLVARIRDVVPASGEEDRFLIAFAEYARLDLPNAWQGWRNPVRYTTLEDIGVDPESLTFEPMPEPASRLTVESPVSDGEDERPLTISEAKRRLAKALGVEERAIEITVRG
jgi:hypothetical protein